jgi:nitroreductase
MNETIDSILNRRSTRAFLPAQIEKDRLEQILKAGLYAPSGSNQQSWHFSVVQDKAVLDSLSESAKNAALKGSNEYVKQYGRNEKLQIFYHAPTAIIVSGDSGSMMPETDCAAAAQNMLIAAESLGVGGCWIALAGLAFQGEEAGANRKKFRIPENYTPYYAIALGYRAGEKSKAPPRKENAVHYM